MNVQQIMEDVIQMQNVQILWVVSHALVILVIQGMVSLVMVMNFLKIEIFNENSLNNNNNQKDINECLSGNGGCSTNALCTNTDGSRTCTCNSGYSGNGVTCSGNELFVFRSSLIKRARIYLYVNE